MKDYLIREIIQVHLEGILLELYLNVDRHNQKSCLKLSISDDGETISFTSYSKWFFPTDINDEIYTVEKLYEKSMDGTYKAQDGVELKRLLSNSISTIFYGVETGNESIIYYIKILTDRNQFMFFNNGDQGWYSFDSIDEILEYNIYDFQWTKNPPLS